MFGLTPFFGKHFMLHFLATFSRPYVLRLARLPYVRQAIAERADLSAFKKRPTLRILTGVFLITISFPMGWPAVAGATTLAVTLRSPWIAALGPVIYGLSHLVFLAGMYLSGAEYTAIFLRWLTRKGVEQLLKWQGLDAEALER